MQALAVRTGRQRGVLPNHAAHTGAVYLGVARAGRTAMSHVRVGRHSRRRRFGNTRDGAGLSPRLDGKPHTRTAVATSRINGCLMVPPYSEARSQNRGYRIHEARRSPHRLWRGRRSARSARCSSRFRGRRTMVVGAVGNRVLCGFPSSCGRVLCVHGSGGVHSPRGGAGSVGSARTQGHGARCGPLVPARTRVTGLGGPGRKRSGLSGRFIGRRQTARCGGHESGFPVRVEGRRRLRIESPFSSSL